MVLHFQELLQTSILELITCDGAMDLGAILQFNSNSLMTEFHQKPASSNKKECVNPSIQPICPT